MEDIRGKHVDRNILHVCNLHSTLDRLLFGRLEDDLYCHLGSSYFSRIDAMVDTGKRSMAGQPRSDRQGH